MEEYPYPIVVDGDWTPKHAKSLKNKLHIYFQSKKKSQGGDCVVQINEKDNIVTVLFKSTDTRDDVLAKADHVITIDKDVVTLNVSKPTDGAPDNIVQLADQASGFQEPGFQGPDQSAPSTGSDPDVKNLQESNTVVLENVADEATKDVLTLLVENVSGVLEKDFSMEFIPELNTAVVTFNSPSAVGKFLEGSKTHRKFQDYCLKTRVLEKSTCVRVENLPADANEMLLDLYFDKWGGPVEKIIPLPLEQAAIISFKEEKDKENVLKREHKICNVSVKIYPYYESLSTALYGSNRPTWKLPEPFRVNVHPAIKEFLLKKKLISSIRDKMGSQFCQINMNKPEVLLSPDPALLKQKSVTKRQIDGWEKKASDTFKDIISNYTVIELPVAYPLWSKVESEIRDVVKDLLFTDMDLSKGVLTLAGVASDIVGVKPILEKMLERAFAQMERERSSVTDVMEMPPAVYILLQQDGLQSAITATPQLNLNFNKKMNQLHVSGLQNEVLAFKNWVLEKKISMKQKNLRMTHSLLEFLRSVNCDEMSNDLFLSHGINAVYMVENDLVLTGSTDRALAEAEKRLDTALQSIDLTVEDRAVLALPQWDDLHKQLQNSYNTSKKRTVFTKLSAQRDKVTVSGFREPVKEVSHSLGNFIEKHTRIEDAVRVKSHAVVEFIKVRKSQDWEHFRKSDEVTVYFDSKRPKIKLSGERMFVQPAMSFFKKMADALYTDTLIIKKAGAKKYFKKEGKIMLPMFLRDNRFVIVFQEDDMLEEDEDDDYKKDGFEDFGELCEVRMPGGVSVTVKKADICKLKVDAVVNAANEDLLHSGGVALALLQAAGPHLQRCCDMYIKANGRLRPGDAVITEAGHLPCKYVVHAVGPRYNSSEKPAVVQRLKSAVMESLKQASGKHCSSIAIPVISSGIFGCPLELCTETIARAVRQFVEDQKQRSSLIDIQLVDNNVSTVNAMAEAVKKEFAAFSPKMKNAHHSKPRGYGGYGHGGQDYSGRGRGNYGNRNQEFRDHGYEPKGRGNRDFEAPAQWREETSGFSGGRSDGLSVLEIRTTQDKLKIILAKGNIQDAMADVIVNTISEDLDLRQGAISKAVLVGAGHRLQAEVTKNARASRLNYGEMVITDGYDLKCAKVFHVVCPFWRGGQHSEDRVLSHIIKGCLKEADAMRMASVSFPAIGTGNLSFPKDLVAKIMLSEVQEFSPRNLKEITMIVHSSDKESIDCFTRVFRHGIQSPIRGPTRAFKPSVPTSGLLGKVSNPSHGVITMQVGQVTLEVSSGDITKEKTDVIVNSSNQKFSLKSGVSKAILDAAGLRVEQECLLMAQALNFQQTEIVTSAGDLPCKNIIHIIGRNRPSEIKDVVLSVLKICEANQLSSVAFPALGTGQGGVNPTNVADAMIDAVVDFVKKKKPANVRIVKFLIFQSSMVTHFQKSMLRRQGEKVEEEKGLIDRFKQFFSWDTSQSPRNEELVVKVEEIEPAVFQLCGETPQDLDKARDVINTFILKEHMSTVIRDPAIDHFTKDDVEMLSAMQRELTVSIKLERKGRDPVITLEGLMRDVHTAESRIRDAIRIVERNETRRRDAFVISSVVEWKYLDGANLKSFDMLSNYDLEKAFQSKIPSVKIKINNEEYDVNVVRLEAKRGSRQIELQRVDLTDLQYSLPSHWDDMTGKSVDVVPLSISSKEYADVEKEFKKTGLTVTIISIERVQNSTLWKNYMIKKEDLEAKNQHKNNEMLLFHGTSADKTDQINHNGFNRSYAGQHGAMYGNGTYFAVDPQYSARSYSKPDVNGHKRMYLAKVLVGDFTQGRSGIIVPPPKNPSSAELYNSVTDNTNNPSMFVIFNDVQAYPEYLITFQ